MSHPTAVILVVGLNRSLIGDHSPRIQTFAEAGIVRTLKPVLPAVTCSVQASMLTGLSPAQHGIVGNGWYNRELAEIHFWKQSNHLVHGEKVWDIAKQRDRSFTCANLFWWFNMYSTVDYSVTPRPMYKADGRKIPDVYTQPAKLRDELQHEFGRFPLFNFWGPMSSIKSSRWIANASMHVHRRLNPTLTLIYLPHLDYALQKFGPCVSQAVAEIDAVVGELIDYFQSRDVRIILTSEYGIEAVDDSVHINRLLRDEGGLRVRAEEGLELLDPGASDAFAVADHQIAHVYVKHRGKIEPYAHFCRGIAGVEQVLDREAQVALGINHERAGELVLVASPGRWFSYDYWLDDSRAPDFARTVDIHRKPGYDPLELFIDPNLSAARFQVASKLLRRKMGFRTLLDVIPLDTKLVRGSHARVQQAHEIRPIVITSRDTADADVRESLDCTAIHDLILEHLGLANAGGSAKSGG
jgi:predicted AlkP superfamily pyrophosphatase or phosphodiesterase